MVIILILLLVVIALTICIVDYKKHKANTFTNSDKKYNDTENYLNTTLVDGITVREHIQNSYNNIVETLAVENEKTFKESLDKQYEFVINNITNRSKVFDVNEEEKVFVRHLLLSVSEIKSRYIIRLDRRGDGQLIVYYNSYPVGRINLRDREHIFMQFFNGLYENEELHDISLDIALENIQNWIIYIKTHLVTTK